MCKKLFSILITCALFNFACYAQTTANFKPKEIKFAAKVKDGIAKLGTGTDARVEVKLRDGAKLKGYISEARDDGFIVVDAKTGAATQVTYPQVKKVKGNNLSTETKIAIGIIILVVILQVVGYATCSTNC